MKGVTNDEGKVVKEYSCEYFYGVSNGDSWKNLPYVDALEVRFRLLQKQIDLEIQKHYLERDSLRIKRLLDAQKDIQRQLKDCK